MIQPGTLLAQAVAVSETGSLHRAIGWYVVGAMGLLGGWALILAILRKVPGRAFWAAFGVGVTGVLVQVGIGTWALSVDGVDPGNEHVFYGIVSVFSLAFAYIYRLQLSKRPALYYAILCLFLMGLGMRAISNFGRSF
ncbi:MAG: hypothetical protein ACFCVC_00555 [Acidimicrobiia bacterium]